MKNKTHNIFSAITVLIALFTIGFGVYEYRREHAFRCDILHAQLQLNNYMIESGKADTAGIFRVTMIDTLGNVLYDTESADVSKMDNHLYRKEVMDALSTGTGFDIKRTSATNGESFFYSATYFEKKGIIIRSAVPYSAPLTASLEQDYMIFYYTIGMLFLLGMILYLRYRLQYSEEEKQRIKRQLTQNAAHELKTPAASIQGYLETILNNNMPEEKHRHFLERCYAASQRMSKLLTDMSMLTRLDENTIHRPVEEIDASKILREIIEDTKPSFVSKGIVLQENLPESMPLKGDESLIYSLFRNIVDNTLAYATGATQFTITASSMVGDKYSFVFADNGQGVPSEHLSHLFERFYRIDKSRSRQLGGTGLGLAIVKNIAVQYGGSVVAEQTVGGGLTIRVIIEKE